MPRTTNANTRKNCWDIKVYHKASADHPLIMLHDKSYPTLKHASADLGMTYAQLCELGPNGRSKNKGIRNQFKYFPTIEIKKLSRKIGLGVAPDSDTDSE